tara:strand:+ start:194 stop:1057 length:864 start_codon:yes stop_codon:yes gene_type:complete
MSTQITTAFINQFSDNVQMLSQQLQSKLSDKVRTATVNGEKAFFDQVGSSAAVARTSRHSDTPIVDTPHSRRMCVMTDYEWSDLVDKSDEVRLLIDPTSVYAKTAAAAMNRAIDSAIITAATGSSFTGKTGSTATALPSGQLIAHGSAKLTLAKLREAREILDINDVDESINRYFAISPQGMTDLLEDTSITSADFNTVRALVQGQVSEFMGFRFVKSTRLAKTGNIRTGFAWAEDGILLAVGQSPMARVDERSDKSYSTQVYYCMTVGATRMEESKVVSVAYDESA